MAISDLLPRHPAIEKIYRLTSVPRNHSSERAVVSCILDIEHNAVENSIAIMLNELYRGDVESIERDIAKAAMTNTGDDYVASVTERIRLLRILWWIFDVYFDGRTDILIHKCKDLKI